MRTSLQPFPLAAIGKPFPPWASQPLSLIHISLNQVEYTSPVTVQAPVEEAAKEPASPAKATEEELSGTQEDNQ